MLLMEFCTTSEGNQVIILHNFTLTVKVAPPACRQSLPVQYLIPQIVNIRYAGLVNPSYHTQFKLIAQTQKHLGANCF